MIWILKKSMASICDFGFIASMEVHMFYWTKTEMKIKSYSPFYYFYFLMQQSFLHVYCNDKLFKVLGGNCLFYFFSRFHTVLFKFGFVSN